MGDTSLSALSHLPCGAFQLGQAVRYGMDLSVCLFSTKFRGQDDQGGFLKEASWSKSPRNREDLSGQRSGVLSLGDF